MDLDVTDYRRYFRMPKVSRITGRTSSITNAFANAIIPAVAPTSDEVREALEILGMGRHVECAYCGDGSSEWDHLRPLVVGKRPTGYISEIHNMVPACGKCNQSKGNSDWRVWMRGPARLSPATRKIADIDARFDRLEDYDSWKKPTKLDFESFLDPDLWAAHWANHKQMLEVMVEAEVTAALIRERVKETFLEVAPETSGH